jgi:hypothetical protein
MTLLRLGDRIINLDNVEIIFIYDSNTIEFTFMIDTLDNDQHSLTITGPEAADFVAHADRITFTPAQLARRENNKT